MLLANGEFGAGHIGASLAGWLISSLLLYLIAHKCRAENAWWAWIPLLDFLLMCELAGRPYWWILLMCIPIVNIVIFVLLWMGIAEARRKPGWLGILMIVPCANLAVLAYLALSE